jgi:mannose-6-phosphate isomerase-like protein (cupin superfamily)
VREHHDAEHTEHVYIIEGTGDMLVGDSIYAVKKGDLIVIPPGTPHAVMTTSEEPLKVVSVQSPDFVGADRVFTNGKTWTTYLETRK